MMATVIRPEISDKKPYYIDRNRYYELKHFCLQYPEWKRLYLSIDGYFVRAVEQRQQPCFTDTTLYSVEKKEQYRKNMELIEQSALATDPALYDYILLAVTKGYSYSHLRTRYSIPCSRDIYYKLYRMFFYILSQKRG